MQINVQAGDIARADAACVVVNLFEGVASPGGATGAVDSALDGMISQLTAAGDIRGKWGELTLLHTFGKTPSPRVLVAGLGKSAEFSVDRARELSANVARYLRGRRVTSAATIAHGGGIGGLDAAACAQAVVEGTALGLYRFDRHKKADDDTAELERLTIVEHDNAKVAALEAAAERGLALADAANFARDLSNEPANVLTPSEFAARAEAMASAAGLGFTVHDRDWAESHGMGAFLGVARGSAQPPKQYIIGPRVFGMQFKAVALEPLDLERLFLDQFFVLIGGRVAKDWQAAVLFPERADAARDALVGLRKTAFVGLPCGAGPGGQ